MVGISSVRHGQAAMRTFTFSDAVLAEIRHDRSHPPHPRVQRKMEVLWLKSQGLTHADIARFAEVAPRSVQRYLDDFEQGGLQRVRQLHWQGKACALDEQRPTLEAYFLEHPPRSAREAQAVIEQLTGIRRGLSQVRAFLTKKLASAGAR